MDAGSPVQAHRLCLISLPHASTYCCKVFCRHPQTFRMHVLRRSRPDLVAWSQAQGFLSLWWIPCSSCLFGLNFSSVQGSEPHTASSVQGRMLLLLVTQLGT